LVLTTLLLAGVVLSPAAGTTAAAPVEVGEIALLGPRHGASA
jgi:hypothetical protein